MTKGTKNTEESQGLVIDVGRLKKDGERFVGEIPVELLDMDPEDLTIRPAGPLEYDLFVQQLGDELLVRGSVSQDFKCTCVRCTDEFDWTAVEDGVSLSVEVAGAEFVDLTEELREDIIILFPAHPVCSEDCKGLCPRCGANLNKSTCTCKPEADSRWGCLDGFITE